MKAEIDNAKSFKKMVSSLVTALKSANTDYEPQVRLRIGKTYLELTGFTVGTYIALRTPASVESTGECFVDANHLYQLKIPETTLKLEVAKDKIKLSAGKFTASLTTLTESDNKIVQPDIADAPKFKVSYARFTEAVKGAHLTPEPGVEQTFDCRITATGSDLSITTLGGERRCSLCRHFDITDRVKSEIRFVVNVTLLNKLLGCVKDLVDLEQSPLIEVSSLKRTTVFRNAAFTFVLPQQSSEFPDLLQMVAKLPDKKFQGKFVVVQKDLSDTVAAACSIPRQGAMATDIDTVFETGKKTLQVRSRTDFGAAKADTTITDADRPMKFGVWDFYFRDVISSIPKSHLVKVEAWKGLVLVMSKDDAKKPTYERLYWLPQMGIRGDA